MVLTSSAPYARRCSHLEDPIHKIWGLTELLDRILAELVWFATDADEPCAIYPPSQTKENKQNNRRLLNEADQRRAAHETRRLSLASNYLRLQAYKGTRLCRSISRKTRLRDDKTLPSPASGREGTVPVFSTCLWSIKADSSGRFLRLPEKYTGE